MLEAARALGQRGYPVTLVDARTELGGRVTLEAALPGLSAWARVRDYRAYQIGQMANVDVYRKSALDTEQVLEFGASRVVLATGAKWRTDGYGRTHQFPIPGLNAQTVPILADAIIAAGV